MENTDPIIAANDISFSELYLKLSGWLVETWNQLNSISTLYQIAAIIAAGLFGWFFSRRLSANFKKKAGERPTRDILARLFHTLSVIAFPALTVVFIWVFTAIFAATAIPNDIIRITASLLNAAIIVRLITTNMPPTAWRAFLAWSAWIIAALYIFKLLDPVTAALDSTAFKVGDARVSVLEILTSIIIAILALWFGRVAGDAAQAQLKTSKKLTPSMSGLLGQVIKISLMVLAVMIALNAVGLKLTAFAFLSGGIGVGIGFGLKSIFSNFISGIIILFEKSIKVGDFIELQSGIRGQVREINIRATLVNTNDDVDILVPNEEFIMAHVINWTLRDARRRLHVPFGVAYGTDKEIVKKAGLEAAANINWTDKSKGREPDVWLVGFGDSSLNYELIVWLIEEAVKKPGTVTASYNWALHSALQKYDLEIPFPQRDINIRQPAEISVTIKK